MRKEKLKNENRQLIFKIESHLFTSMSLERTVCCFNYSRLFWCTRTRTEMLSVMSSYSTYHNLLYCTLKRWSDVMCKIVRTVRYCVHCFCSFLYLHLELLKTLLLFTLRYYIMHLMIQYNVKNFFFLNFSFFEILPSFHCPIKTFCNRVFSVFAFKFTYINQEFIWTLMTISDFSAWSIDPFSHREIVMEISEYLAILHHAMLCHTMLSYALGRRCWSDDVYCILIGRCTHVCYDGM